MVPQPNLSFLPDPQHKDYGSRYMIHQILHFFNILNEKTENIFGKEIYEQHIRKFEPVRLECSNCHCKGSCIRHGYYSRSYLLNAEDLTEGNRIRILRVLCKECGHTHAVLPEEIVPYSQYSIIFMFLVLYQYYMKEGTAEEICNGMGITVPVLYRWIDRFERQKNRFLGVILAMQWPGQDAVQWLRGQTEYGSGIASRILKKEEKMPMQAHRNPPNTHHPVFC